MILFRCDLCLASVESPTSRVPDAWRITLNRSGNEFRHQCEACCAVVGVVPHPSPERMARRENDGPLFTDRDLYEKTTTPSRAPERRRKPLR